MTYEEQLSAWVEGKPIHADQCTPDFSCCRPDLLWPKEKREQFRDKPYLRDIMLMESLQAAISRMGKSKDVRIIGTGE